MSEKLVFLSTEYVKPHLERVLPRLGLDASFQVLAYRPFEDIFAFFRQVPPDAAGIITSGSRFSSAFQAVYPDDPRIVLPMGINDAEVHRLFWRLKRDRPDLDFQRVYADFLDELHLDIPSFLTVDHGIPLSVSMNAVGESGPEDFLRGEQEQFRKLLSVWETGQFQVIITRYSGLIPMLRERGVTVYYPFNSVDGIRSACTHVLREIEMRRLQDFQAAEIHVNLWTQDPAYTAETLYEQKLLQLQQTLMDYFGGQTKDLLFRRSHFGIDILTDRKTVALCTRNYTCCELSAFLNARLSFQIFVGYGVGKGVYQARLNAISATRESEVSGGSFLVNENDQLIELWQAPPPDVSLRWRKASHSVYAYVPSHTGISQNTIDRVFAALRAAPSQRITSQELSQALSTTRRSANYALRSMTQAGLLQIVSERKPAGRGRPEAVYGRASKTE